MLRKVPVSHVSGIGQAKQKLLAELGVFSVDDLVHYFPFRYEDRRLQPFEAFQDGTRVTARVVVEGTCAVRWVQGKSICTARLRVDQRFPITGIWFNQHYLKSQLVDGRVCTVTGKYDRARNTLVVSHTEFKTHQSTGTQLEWVPVYTVSKSLSSVQLQAMIRQAMTQFGPQIEDVLPSSLIRRYKLISHVEAVTHLHFPANQEDLHQSHRRLAFEEFFLFQLQLQWFRRYREQTVGGIGKAIAADAWKLFSSSLPATMTNAQVEACKTIQQDLQAAKPMSRIVQGDVGSGKTWVAFWAAYAAYRAGYQTALMAPTEILAMQHFEEAQRRLQSLGMRFCLLTGSTTEKERTAILAQIKAGELDLVIGTHALITGDVEFFRLGLVVTDEQHRFGVSQRALFREKGDQPDVLFLSATPIPRTLALAIYGDLDVSVLNELPAGRMPIKTYWLRLKEEDKAIRFVRRELAAGRQAFVVAPLIEESEKVADVASANELYVRLQERFAGFTVGLLHGKMTAREKGRAMHEFVTGQIRVIVSTTVIEVGIHVPNASVMLIYHAERFGLAQLHQLRGRVGRGTHQSLCVLLSDAPSEMSKQRLETMVKTVDGFEIAQRDLELRGPGEFLGLRQSGLPEFTVGDLTRDFKIMEVARSEATALVCSADFWLLPEYERLRVRLESVPSGSYFKQ